MKKNTHKRIIQMLNLMKRKEAYFFEEENGSYFYTYPKKGWVKPATINGVPLIYRAEHDKEVDLK